MSDRKVVLFDHAYEWKRREKDGGRKAPKRKAGQLMLRRLRGEHALAVVSEAWVPPCQELLYQPIRELHYTS